MHNGLLLFTFPFSLHYITIGIHMKTHTFRILALAGAIWSTISISAHSHERPMMGWSSWNTYRVHISSRLICSQADAMVRQGLAAAGYRYINIDDGYFGGRDSVGHLLVHPQRFPEGLQPVVNHIHALGLKAGIYSDAGRNTCGHYWDHDALGRGVGLYGHDSLDADYFFSRLGFDFIKVDFCGGDASQNAEHLDLDEQERYTAIRRALDATGRKDIRFNVCRWAYPGTWVHDIASSWRIDADISPQWNAVKRILAANRYLSAYASDGHYNDMDMLEIGRGLSESEERTHFGMWCMQSSPLLIGCDMNTIPSPSLALLLNPELIAIDQDPLGLQAYVAKADRGLYLYVKDIHTPHGRRRAVAICNTTDEAREFQLHMADVDLGGKVKVRDAFTRSDLPAVKSGSMSVHVLPHDTRIFILKADRRMERTVYEAETAWLARYQRLGHNNALGYADYVESTICSGGAKVAWLGHHEDNTLEWRNVYSRHGGEYLLTLSYTSDDDRRLFCSVNGEKSTEIRTPHTGPNGRVSTVSMKVHLHKGSNTIRLSNPTEWCPDIDCMTLRKQ